MVGWEEKGRIKLTSAKVVIEVIWELDLDFAFPVYLSRGLDAFLIRWMGGWLGARVSGRRNED